MGSRLKEDEKNEKAIRALLRKTPNRRCINCNSLGPQYTCLTFWTFVCTQCSGIHREFTHRVKSVSMSKFTSQEVASLEAGGNERGKELYFKDWDPQRQPLPDSSNVDRLREFIKMVYVEKRFSGERPLPRARGVDRDEGYDNRRPDPRPGYHSDSRSPPYEDRYEDRWRRSNAGYDDRRSDERGGRFDEKRSPARFESEKRSPARFESDRSRYDRNYHTDARGYDERSRYETRDRYQYEDRYNGPDRRFDDRFANERGSRGYGGSSPPPMRPVKEILGTDIPPLRVETFGSQTNGAGRDNDKLQGTQRDGRGQRFGSSSSFGSVDGAVPVVASAAAPVVKREDSTSLIDFSVEPDPPVVSRQADPFGLTAAVQPPVDSLNSTGWATFESAAPAPPLGTGVQAPTVAAPGASVAGVTDILGGFTNSTTGPNGDSQWVAQWAPPSGAPLAHASANSQAHLAGPSVSTNGSQQAWNAFSATPGEASSVLVSQGSRPLDPQIASTSVAAIPTRVAAQGAQAQPSGRPEIPEDFFGRSLSSTQFTGGQTFGTQYPPMGRMGVMPPGGYTQHQKSSNPFDIPGDTGPGHVAGEFPSLAPLQAALPTFSIGPRPVAGPGLGAYGSQWSHANTGAQPQALYTSMPAGPPQTLYPSGPMSAGSGHLFVQPTQTALPQAIQGPLAPALGVNVPGSYVTAPNFRQGLDSFYSSQNFQPLSSQSSFGVADSTFSTRGAGQFSYQNPLGPAGAGNFPSTDSFMAGPPAQQGLSPQGSLGPLGSLPGVDSWFPSQQPVTQQRILSQGSLGSLSNVPGVDSLFPTQPAIPGQQLVSHSSLGNLSSITSNDTQFAMQNPSQFSTHAVGNPFG